MSNFVLKNQLCFLMTTVIDLLYKPLSHTKPIPPIIKKNEIKIVSPLLKTGSDCLQ